MELRRELDRLWVKQGSLLVPFHDITDFESAPEGYVIGKGPGNTLAMVEPGSPGGGGGGGGGGSLVLLDEQVASNSATLDFATGIDDTYDAYLLQVGDIVPATDNTGLWLRFSTDGGSSFIATGYHHALRNYLADAFDGEVNSQNDSKIPLATSLGNSTSEHWNVNVWLNNPRSGNWKSIRFDGVGIIANPLVGGAHGMGFHGTTAALNALRLLMSSGNIASGWARLYGFAKTASSEGAAPQWVTDDPRTPAETPHAKSDPFAGSSLDAKWTEVNKETAVITVARSRLIIECPSAGGVNFDMRCVEQAVESTPWSIKARVLLCGRAAFNHAGLFVKDGTGKYVTALIRANAFTSGVVTAHALGVEYMTDVNNRSSFPHSQASDILPGAIWLRLRDDGTNLYADYSWDGDLDSFVNYWSASRTAFISGTQSTFGLYADSLSNTGFKAQFQSFTVLNSA